MNMSAREYNEIMSERKPSKYRNKKVVIDGITMDSLAEAARYLELKTLERAGVVESLEVHPRVQLEVRDYFRGFTKICTYAPDFRYWDNDRGRIVVEDVKGKRTPEYRLKKKLYDATHRHPLEEIEGRNMDLTDARTFLEES